jgi:hypothetical protein
MDMGNTHLVLDEWILFLFSSLVPVKNEPPFCIFYQSIKHIIKQRRTTWHKE